MNEVNSSGKHNVGECDLKHFSDELQHVVVMCASLQGLSSGCRYCSVKRNSSYTESFGIESHDMDQCTPRFGCSPFFYDCRLFELYPLGFMY